MTWLSEPSPFDRWTYADATVWRITEPVSRTFRRITEQGIIRIVRRGPRTTWNDPARPFNAWTVDPLAGAAWTSEPLLPNDWAKE